MPLGFLFGFAFPTGMRLVAVVDRQPTPWFWGINGATGVLASVVGLMFDMSLGINMTSSNLSGLLSPVNPDEPCAVGIGEDKPLVVFRERAPEVTAWAKSGPRT